MVIATIQRVYSVLSGRELAEEDEERSAFETDPRWPDASPRLIERSALGVAAHPIVIEPLVGAPDIDRLQQPGRAAHCVAQFLDRGAVEATRGVRAAVVERCRAALGVIDELSAAAADKDGRFCVNRSSRPPSKAGS